MANTFQGLEAKMSPESRARSDALYQDILAEMPLMEYRTDMYISTLRDSIRAMGGDLEIIARFPDGSVKITHFAGLEPIDQLTL